MERVAVRRSLHRMVRSHYAGRVADAATELLLADRAIGKCARKAVQLRSVKREIRQDVIWRPLLALYATVVAVMNEHAWWRREHAPGDQRNVVDPADALPAADKIGLAGLAC